MTSILKMFFMPVSLILATFAIGLCLSRVRRPEKTGKYIIGRVLLLVGLLAMYALSIHPVANALIYPLESRYPAVGAEALKDVDAVIVLGGGGSQASKLRPQADLAGNSLARVAGGVRVFRSCNARYLVFSGYSGVEGGLTVAEIMARAAFEMGVPSDKMIVEKKASDTFEHPARLLEILPETKEMKIAVVTCARHMPRSIAAFAEYFARDRIVPAPVNWYYSEQPLTVRSFIPSAGALSVSTRACHEYLGRVWYYIRPKPKVKVPETRPTR